MLQRLVGAIIGGPLLGAIAITIIVAWTSLNVSANTSGPDPSGYTWTDSNVPAPFIAMDWIDITTTGTLIDNDTDFSNADDGVWTQTLPFSFNFFGNTYDSVQIATNGFISFTIPAPQASPCNQNFNWDNALAPNGDQGYPIPHDDVNCLSDGWGYNPLIAAWFDDLDPGQCGGVYYGTTGTAPNRTFVVQWENVCHNDCETCGVGDGITFEIILYEGSNDIRIQYMDGFFSGQIQAQADGGSATSGLSFNGSTGLPYSHAQQVLTSGLAVLYSTGTPATATPLPSPSPTATPSPTPTATLPPAGESVLWGDANCSGSADPVDSLLTLRYDAGLSANTGECPDFGQIVDVADASPHPWGDVDCGGDVTPVDSLKLLRHDAGLSVAQAEGCPLIGVEVTVVVS